MSNEVMVREVREICKEFVMSITLNDGTDLNVKARVVYLGQNYPFPYTWEASHWYKPFEGAATASANDRLVRDMETAAEGAKNYLVGFRDDGIMVDETY